jgi:predicted small lipoprotein YifL
MIRAPFSTAIGAAAIALALAIVLPGCGQKGPLKLPEPPKPAEPAK